MPSAWHAYVTEAYALSRLAWEAKCEEFACGYETEESEFRLICPAPTFKSTLIQSKGWARA